MSEQNNNNTKNDKQQTKSTNDISNAEYLKIYRDIFKMLYNDEMQKKIDKEELDLITSIIIFFKSFFKNTKQEVINIKKKQIEERGETPNAEDIKMQAQIETENRLKVIQAQRKEKEQQEQKVKKKKEQQEQQLKEEKEKQLEMNNKIVKTIQTIKTLEKKLDGYRDSLYDDDCKEVIKIEELMNIAQKEIDKAKDLFQQDNIDADSVIEEVNNICDKKDFGVKDILNKINAIIEKEKKQKLETIINTKKNNEEEDDKEELEEDVEERDEEDIKKNVEEKKKDIQVDDKKNENKVENVNNRPITKINKIINRYDNELYKASQERKTIKETEPDIGLTNVNEISFGNNRGFFK